MPEISPGEFTVALGELRSAIDTLRRENEHVSTLVNQIHGHFEATQNFWKSPSSSSFETMAEWFTRSSRDLEEILAEAALRMQTSYDNYVQAEHSNTRNVGG
ncbi:WXG100 family type VII secretion target [Streptomyces sp. NPDC012461]|uniref:WXG100 family type VII secretion target n=1 Tax=unclassified Streptomyces TaxID=2593676 RepID=UPI0013DC6FB5|nr:WXG100 family type VII secretion target [Streptomyces sp. S12]NED16765.1 WXG100 family type VII secretion target [Streptomyces sp. SID9913]